MLIPPAYAQAAGGGASPDMAAGFLQFLPLLLVFVAFYFLMMRPQQQRAKALQNAIAAVKKGDSVITAGGMLGKVSRIEDRYLEIEVAPNVKVKVLKATIAEVVSPTSTKPAND